MLPRRIVVDEEDLASRGNCWRMRGWRTSCGRDRGGPKTETTDDAVLGGRLRITQKNTRPPRWPTTPSCLQPRPARGPGDRVIEFGAARRAGLALAVRCPEVDVTLVEIDPELSGIAAANVVRNGLAQRVRAVTIERHRASG